MREIPYGRQHITEDDIRAVADVLKSDYLTQGPAVIEFEKKFGEYIGSPFNAAVSNGTAALHLAVMALGLPPNKRVLTTPITFAASANCVSYVGGEIELIDIDPRTFIIDLNRVEDRVRKGDVGGIIPVDFAGLAVNMEDVRKIADRHGCWVLEDACHAPGGFFIDSKEKQVNCGSGVYEDAAIFSFHPVKHIAAGEGGMVTSSNAELLGKVEKLRTHGIHKNADQFMNEGAMVGASTSNSDEYPAWYYEMDELGYNYRMTDIQSALALSQLQKAESGMTRRRALADRYIQAFRDNPNVKVQSLNESERKGHAYHLFVISAQDRLGLYTHLRSKGIFAQVHYIPLHYLPYYKHLGSKTDLSNAEGYYDHCLSLPMFPSLSDEEQEYVIESVNSFYP